MQIIEIIQGDITTLEVDAIVNAANNALSGGGGVDGAIHRAAGPQLLEECKQLGRCETGFAKITKGYDLPAKYIIHAVGPVWYGGHKGEAQLLESCYRESLQIATEHQIKSIAFPAISCGAYRFPIQKSAKIALETIGTFLEQNDTIENIFLVCFESKTYRSFSNTLEELQGSNQNPNQDT